MASALNFIERAITFTSYLALGLLFAYTIYFPKAFDNFLFFSGFAVFGIEFITIHSTLFFMSFLRPGRIKGNTGIIAFLVLGYSLFAGAFALIAGNLLIFFYFWYSSALKMFGYHKGDETERQAFRARWAANLIVMVIAPTIAIFLNPIPSVVWVFTGAEPSSIPWAEISTNISDINVSVSIGGESSQAWQFASIVSTYFFGMALLELFRKRIERKMHKIEWQGIQ